MRRRMPRFSALFPQRTRQASSCMPTSSTQWHWFSMAQCARMRWLKSAADSTRLLRCAPLLRDLALVASVDELAPRLDHHYAADTRPQLQLRRNGMQIGGHDAAARLQATVVFVDGDVLLQATFLHAGSHVRELRLDALRKRRLVVLHRHDVVGLGSHDCSKDLSLASHRVGRDHRAAQIQCLDQLGYRCDLVALGGRLQLPQRDASAHVPSRHHVRHRHVPVMRATQAFAIDRHRLPLQQRTHALHPVDQAGLEPLGVQQREQPAEWPSAAVPATDSRNSSAALRLPMARRHPSVSASQTTLGSALVVQPREGGHVRLGPCFYHKARFAHAIAL